MKYHKKNHQIEKAGRSAGVFRILPIVAAMAASGMSQSVGLMGAMVRRGRVIRKFGESAQA